MKKKSRFPIVYLILITLINYLPIFIVVAFSFNASKLPTSWEGFSFKGYAKLFENERLIQSLGNSILLGVSSTLLSAAIGTIGAVGLAKTHSRTNKVVSYLAALPLMIPEIILGMVFLAFFSLLSTRKRPMAAASSAITTMTNRAIIRALPRMRPRACVSGHIEHLYLVVEGD